MVETTKKSGGRSRGLGKRLKDKKIGQDISESAKSNFDIGLTEEGSENFDRVFLEDVSPDPENPRLFNLDVDAITKLPKLNEIYEQNKQEQIEDDITTLQQQIYDIMSLSERPESKDVSEALMNLALDIYHNVLIQPITVYPLNEYHTKFRIITGHRRYFASLIAGNKSISAKIIKKPERLRQLQYSENESRADFTPYEHLCAVRAVVKETQSHGGDITGPTQLAKLLHKSAQIGQDFWSLLKLDEGDEIIAAVRRSQINIRNAAGIASLPKHKEQILQAAKEGASSKEISQQIKNLRDIKKLNKANKSSSDKNEKKAPQAGRQTSVFSLKTSNKNVAEYIVNAMSKELEKTHPALFEALNMNEKKPDLKTMNKKMEAIIKALNKSL